MSYQLIKPYTEQERLDFIVKYNHNMGLLIEETDVALYALEANEIMLDGVPQLDPEFDNKQLQLKREEKLQELTNALTDKQNNVLSTLTFNIPVTLRKGIQGSEDYEEKYVESFKLLTVTSAGSLTNVLMGYALVASSADIADIIVTADGYIIVGLNELVENTKLINLIFAECTRITANMTIYFREIKNMILNATEVKELDDIIIDFTQF